MMRALLFLLIVTSVLFVPSAEAMFQSDYQRNLSPYTRDRKRGQEVDKCQGTGARYNQQTDRCECKATTRKEGYCSILAARSKSPRRTPKTEDEKLCGPHSYYSLSSGCSCNQGYFRKSAECLFRGCPAGYRLTADKDCIVKQTSFDKKLWVNCTTQRPCTCPLGYEPLANRTCIPR